MTRDEILKLEHYLQKVFRLPAIWLLGVALLGLVPFFARFSPLLTSAGEDPAWRWAREWAFPAGLIGALLGAWALAELTCMTMRLPSLSRWIVRLGGLLAPILALQALLLAGACATSLEPGSIFPVIGRMLCSDLHLVALAALLWRFPLGARGALFLGIAWLLPAFLAEGGTVVALVASWMDAGRFLRHPEFAFPSPAAWAALGPPIGLLGASLLFRAARI